MTTNFIAIIPAYKPTEALIPLLAALRQADFETILIDDGSGPAYEEIFQKARLYSTVLAHAMNCGKGRALKTAFSHIIAQFPDEPELSPDGMNLSDSVIVTLDADGQHTVEDAVKLCSAAMRNPDALFLGSRKMIPGVPLRSRLGNSITRHVYRLLTGNSVYDTQTGLRAFSLKLLPMLLSIDGERYEYEMNVLLSCSQMKIPIIEETIKTIYLEENAGSHFNPILDSARVYIQILKFAFSSFIGFIVDYLLYGVLLIATSGMGAAASLTLSNIAARIASASVNYTLNRRMVFRDDGSIYKSAAQYALLAAVVLAGNTMMLNALSQTAGIHPLAAKLITETLFFAVSWLAQRFIIFRNNSERIVLTKASDSTPSVHQLV